MELSESDKVQKRYIRGNDLVYADKGGDNTSGEVSEKQYYVTDPHGNVVQLTDESGAVIQTYEYDSFGNEVKPDGKDDNPFRYCGEYYDKETEEIYLRARYYQPTVGRFLTRDTYTGEENEPLSLHLYTYCENDGVNCIDSSGHKKNYFKKRYKKCINKTVLKKPNVETYEYIAKLIKKGEIKKKGKKFNNDLNKFKTAYKNNISIYQEISNSTNLPSKLVAAIHFRENSDDCLNGDFKARIKNGGFFKKPSKRKFVNKAIKELKNYEDFRTKYELTSKSSDIIGMCSFAAIYNGKYDKSEEYGKQHTWKHHPYVFSGTNQYTMGKFTHDYVYNPKKKDKQVGVLLLIDKIYNIK